ncbi:triose-phosphate isomerase [candidate division WOR-1 bacterium RIFOXYA2_FULL_36_21]|uniref:Triosephosphate isomerase n=1 Tax=candidate division WOR-1 bacterium RIFOXYB2_FULL_36_35 TaxID=1802578 RepID=A0A1F4RZ38_UNCSA|nr:MAG: triose-phosphate isomerase [candidate division WOR-1 bacterium RIFOXYA2_FULL_36_21]OGC13455.1 MAG: triose-phosphate isomerase [candidate division WOR-1 bacterium RIFOXYB2_FULL_36_35]OGC21180.1 MAG: triose-phosphate isomerase [candidate division WOR-1 bacterium RIFOXYA12_FULL_36_13]
MRRPIIAGNWKLNKTIVEAIDLASKIKASVGNVSDVEIVVCPAFVAIDAVSQTLTDSTIGVGAQDMYWKDSGAFTGEVSAPMIRGAGASYVIIGHSERRQYFGETDETVNKKLMTALSHGLVPIVCIGETLEERESDKTFDVIKTQIKGALKDISESDLEKIIIAYEPVWAIGTGKTATPEQAQEVHAFIRKHLPSTISKKIRILYGGSVNPSNIKELMKKEDIDGGLIGGAALKVEDFEKLVKFKE